MQPSVGGVNINQSKDKRKTSKEMPPLSEEDKRDQTRPGQKPDPDFEKGNNPKDEISPPNETTQESQLTAACNKFIEWCLICLSLLLAVATFPLSLCVVFKTVHQFERVVILRNGKVYSNRAFGPGLIFCLPCIDTLKYTDLRIICYDVPPQEALTKDSLTVSVDAVVYYKIFDPVSAVVNVANFRRSTQFLAATTLRNALGSKKLSEILADRPGVSSHVFENMKSATEPWGIKVVRVELKDISLPLQLQKAMAAEAESTRLANAKIIVAKAEIEATKNLQKATEMLMDNPMCIQLRYLQSLQTIVGENTHTIVFPFSVQNLRKIFK